MKLSASLNSSRIFSFESMLTRIFISIVQIHKVFLNKAIFGLLISPLLNAVKTQENITTSCKRVSPDFLVRFVNKNYFKKTVKLAFHIFMWFFPFWNLQSNARKLKLPNHSRFKLFFKDLKVLQICFLLLADKVVRDPVYLVGYFSWPWSEAFLWFEALQLSNMMREFSVITEDLV